jgi:uncharacterized protein
MNNNNGSLSNTNDNILSLTRQFFEDNPQIQSSHGWQHAYAVFQHACRAVACHNPTISVTTAMEIPVAALLHDVDDHKYFPENVNFENAQMILKAAAEISDDSAKSILYMISLVSCSRNGNSIPCHILEHNSFHLLIPRWSDRVEAVGKIGVVRCYQYNNEHGQPFCSPNSPKPTTIEELWKLATPERFEKYQQTGHSDDMISHYYDKLLHVARPHKNLVRNSYLEEALEVSSRELVEVCLRFGRTGEVDEEYIQLLMADLITPT